MDAEDKRIMDRLGEDGLARVLADVLDQRKLVRLANGCGLEYPGMRTQSLKRARLIEDLVARSRKDDAAVVTINRTLRKETRDASTRWGRLGNKEKAKRIGDEVFLRRKGNLGLHLFLVAIADGDSEENGFESLLARQQLGRILDRETQDKQQKNGSARPPREQIRLEKKLAELKRKHQHLETQLTKSRETERTFKRDLIQRKGEHAEARMLVERLRGELAEAQQLARRVTAESPVTPALQEAVEKMDRAVRRLATEQKKAFHKLEKLEKLESNGNGSDRRSERVKLDPSQLDPLAEAVDALRKDLSAVRRERRKDVKSLAASIETLREELDQVRQTRGKPRRGSRAKGEPERVGVFIDVQNMYYGARQLKGKLDFDALQEAAVRGRRLIQAVAYVVESKEIDQSGFIKLLEQRAIEVRRKTLQVRADGSMKGDWDMELALDILDAAPGLDVVVLVSGDGDFTSLVKHVKTMGPRVEVIGFPRTTAKSLLGAADGFQPLDRKFMIYPARARVRTDPKSADKASGSKKTA